MLDITSKTSSDRSIIDRLIELQDAVSAVRGQPISDAAFAKTYLPFSETSWSRLKSGKYGAGEERLLAKAALAAEEIPARIEALRRAAGADESFVHTSIARAAISAVRAARDSGSRRIVPVVAPTGFGKSALSRYFAARGAIVVSGRQAWQYSYKAFCLDVCTECGAAMPKSTSESDAELEMIRRLRVKGAGLLFVDEANTVGGAFANALKLIHNQTEFSIIVAAVPGPWDKFCARAEEEVRQVINRCQPIIRASRLLESDITPFLGQTGFADTVIRAILPTVAGLANTFGGVATVLQLAAELADSPDKSRESAEKAISNIRRAIVASGLPINN